jgi:uncharacterized protein (TIGR03437 family)
VTALYKTNVNSPCSATIVPLPTELCGVKVKFELEKVGVQGVEELLPVLAVERDRVTFQLPVIGTTFLLDTINTFYKVQILGPNNLTSETKILPLVHYAPALYKDSAGHGIITGSDGKRITPTNPALPGAKVVVQGTGFGFGYPGLKESEPGTVFPLETNQEGGLQLQIRDPIAVLVGGQRVQALSAFKTPKEVGNDSVIFRVPTNLSPGNYPVQACIRYDGYLPPEIAHIVKREVCSENTVMIAVDTLSQTAEYTGRVTAKVQLPNGTPLPGVTVTAQGIFEPGAALSARTAVTDSSGHAIFDVPAGERAKLRVDAQVPDGDEGGDYIFASQPELEVHSGGEAVPITVYYMTRKCFQFTTELKLSAKAKLIPGTNVYPLPNVSVVEKINGDIISRGRSDALGQYCTKRLNPGDKSKSEFVPTLWGFEFDPPTVSAAVSGNEAVKQLTITGKKKGLKQTGSAVLSGKKPQKKKAAPPKKRRAAPEKRTKGSKK